jgi:hypothetical protein
MAFELEVISEGKHPDLLMTIRDSLPFQFHLHSKAERKERVCLYLGLHKDRTPGRRRQRRGVLVLLPPLLPLLP